MRVFTQAEIDVLKGLAHNKSAKKKTPAADDPYDNAGLMDAYINTPKKSAKKKTPKKSWFPFYNTV
jgi:hypothetical protein